MVEGALSIEFVGRRRRMIESLQEQGIRDLSVLKAFDLVPRHLFVPEAGQHRAYEESSVPIGLGQTISQPYVHARALELLALTGRERVLEIGTGSGHQTALLTHLAAQVFTIERWPALLEVARAALRNAGITNVVSASGDGTIGWREYAPYDGIVVGAGAPDIPAPLAAQLAEGGRLLIPLGTRTEQMLTLCVKRDGQIDRRDITPVRFVPLVGAAGWPAI
jgi:protein-L-isoaspartate(D-aspartate) O-methyltransferase